MTAKNKKVDHGILAKGSVQRDAAELALATAIYQFDGVDVYTADHTFTAADLNRTQDMNSASARKFLVPTNATWAAPVGTCIVVRTRNTGATTIEAVTAGTTTIEADAAVTTAPLLRAKFAMAIVEKVATDAWAVSGNVI